MDIDLDKLERIGRDATGGEWRVDDLGDEHFLETNHRYGIGSDAKDVYRVAKIEGFGQESLDDAEFIATARNNWQILIDEIRRLRALRQAEEV